MKKFFKICIYVIPSIVVILICFNLHNSGFSSYTKKHEYQCKVIGGEKVSGGYKRSGHMYLILQETQSNRIFSVDASPEDYHMYSNKPGTILTYTFVEAYVAPNETYELYRNIFMISLSVLFTLLLFGPILIAEMTSGGIDSEWFDVLWLSAAILFITTLISYNFII